MRHLLTSSSFLILLTYSLAAQTGSSGGDKIQVPLHDPNSPARIHAQTIHGGGITVRGADVREVTVESRNADSETRTRPRHSERRDDPKSAGLKRLDIGSSSGLDVEENNNLVTVKTSPWGGGSDLLITVPRRSSLQLKCLNGRGIAVENVEGEIDVDDLNGSITLRNVSGSVLAHSLNGSVVAVLDRVDNSKPMSFSTLNGDIDVTLPESTRANIRMKTDNGEIYSDFDVKMSAGSSTVEKGSGRQPDGRYRMRLDRSLRGAINGGGPEFQFTSFNGRIYIRKRK